MPATMRPGNVLQELAATPALQHRITLAQYHRMIDVGVLDEDAHLELIGGVLVQMTPQSAPHAMTISLLARALTLKLPGHLIVRVQMPISIGRHSEPEPDLAIVRLSEVASRAHHPRKPLLVVEVARASLGWDRRVKSALYARARIPEYWIINTADRTVEVHRKPDGRAGKYRSIDVVGEDGTVAPSGFAGPKVSVRMLLGRPQH